MWALAKISALGIMGCVPDAEGNLLNRCCSFFEDANLDVVRMAQHAVAGVVVLRARCCLKPQAKEDIVSMS